MIARLPIRVRLTLPFALAMAVVLVATGGFVYVRVGSALLSSIDQTLRVQAQEAVPRLQQGKSAIDQDAPVGTAVGELITPAGRVLDPSPPTLPKLLDAAPLARVRDGATLKAAIDDVPGLNGRWRVLALPVTVGGSRDVLVLGQSLAARRETLHRLRNGFALAAPAALLLAVWAGYLLAGAALRPVEAMRRRAAAITASTPGKRLPVPPSHDEVARLAETLNDMLARLESAFEHERRFVADASHELRTPLALLRTELELALRRPRSAAELEEALRSAAEETERLSRLAEDLLLIARSDQGSLPVRPERLAAYDVMAAVAERFAVRAERLGRRVEIEASGDAIVDADPMRLEQALGNLVDNALTYGRGTVTLAALRRGDRVELHVRDEGDGFPPGFAERAFDRFSRADDARSPGGTGLGLAIVQLIAQAHGGNAALAEADVWLSLPAASAPRYAELSSSPSASA
ncbi:MAG: HAMP domain-containing protein [Actinobacteria bacterium]|nr:HAMP domain-containing protein [Actinomycetota bacterium]MBV8395062.1 HAMP domain-containing protein [Actinomycetota bacterium]